MVFRSWWRAVIFQHRMAWRPPAWRRWQWLCEQRWHCRSRHRQQVLSARARGWHQCNLRLLAAICPRRCRCTTRTPHVFLALLSLCRRQHLPQRGCPACGVHTECVLDRLTELPPEPPEIARVEMRRGSSGTASTATTAAAAATAARATAIACSGASQLRLRLQLGLSCLLAATLSRGVFATPLATITIGS